MKMPNIFRLKDKKPAAVELGATGSLFFGGMLTGEEYNSDLKGDKAIAVYERMRRSDGQVKAALLACALPLRAAHWDVEAASDSKQDQEIANFIHENLFGGMTITWDDFLRHAIDWMLAFGFAPFEKVWELKGGKYKWRKFAPRLPRTIRTFKLDKEGGLAGLEQLAFKGDSYETISIPVEKLLVFVNDREGGNYWGTSLLRAAYKHWYFKDQLYRIDGIAAERHGIGLAVFKYPTATPDPDKKKISDVGERLHAHERAYVALPEEIDFELKGVSGQLHDIKGSIEHHDLQISRSILAQFINLGSSDVGSFALSQDQSGFFLMALRAVGRNLCDTFNLYALRQLVDYNWQVDAYPKLAVSGLEYYDIAKYSEAISKLGVGGWVLPDEEIEAELRRQLHLPAKRAPTTTARETFRMKDWQPWRPPRVTEQSVAFKDISDTLDTAEDKFIKAAKKVQERQISKLVDIVVRSIVRGDADKLGDIDTTVPYKTEMAKAIETVLGDLYDYGRQQVKQEIGKQRGKVKGQEPPLGTEKAVKAFIATRAKVTATVLGAKLQGAVTWAALAQIKSGTTNKADLVTALVALSDKELTSTAKFSVAEAFNMGRDQQAREMADEIDRVEYSALLDVNTCSNCTAVDGKSFKYPSAEWDEVAPPYKKCDGGDRCRCVGVYIYKSETKAVQ